MSEQEISIGASTGADTGTNIDDLANRLFFRLYQCANIMHKTGTRALEETRITTQQWAIIGALARDGMEEGISVGDLTRFLLVSRQNLTGVLSRLEAQGLIERVVSPVDSRSRLIRLSAKGRDVWRRDMSAKIAAFYDAALEGFSTTDKIHAIHYFDKLLTNMKRLDQGSEES
ncbi:MarR family winged helix-turn-helix transcriptional regulator [Roseibium aggregatum]|uniref:MarR family transcriptional regulator n=1 Tax=Roseibium aggregatum TaxID=187304 RepID=A0A926S7X7_9HYPH|nr:MarR family transcriptional regulator [Roseibium aggregatum]MBD1548800.1 MarR family transcriptional regulator [Roseibium aggregatum]